MTKTLARTHLGWVLGLTSTAYFMVVLDSVVVVTALPRMQRDLHAGLASLQWTLTAYNIAFAAGIITAAAARRPLRPPPGLHHRPRPVHRRLGGLRARPGRLRADRRPHRAGPGRRDRPPAQPHHPDDRLPGRTARDDRRHLRRTRRAGRRDGADRRRRGHPGNRLALDLLDQRADRRRRPAARHAAAARKPRRPGAARPARRHAPDRRRRRHRVGPGPRGPVGLGEPRDHRLPGLPAPSCCSPSPPGSSASASRWCRCACSAAARSRSATPRPSS